MCLLKQAEKVHIILNRCLLASLAVDDSIDLHRVVVAESGEFIDRSVEIVCSECDASVGISIFLVIAENTIGRNFVFMSIGIGYCDCELIGRNDFIIGAKLACSGSAASCFASQRFRGVVAY